MNVLTLLPLNIGTAVVGISNINFFVLIVFEVHSSYMWSVEFAFLRISSIMRGMVPSYCRYSQYGTYQDM